MKLLTVIGARPQFIKAAMLSKEFQSRHEVQEVIVHTGQHYDPNMSQIFFDDLQIPPPAHQLHTGGGSHAEMTAAMLIELEKICLSENPDAVLVYGDTNSTLAASLTAAKLQIPVYHVEAGLRSFNRAMPEEINRVMTDHLSSLLFAPTLTAVKNLAAEGITQGVVKTGDIMFDSARFFAEYAETHSSIRTSLAVQHEKYLLATVHRQENTDSPERLTAIFSALQTLHREDGYTVILPLHPRTKKLLAERDRTDLPDGFRVTEPLSFFDMIALERHAACIVTDSGGVQKEAYFHGVPCVTVRDETEWVETVSAGWNTICGADHDKILSGVRNAHKGSLIPDFGDGHAAKEIADKIITYSLGL